jgi:hypothetical protein
VLIKRFDRGVVTHRGQSRHIQHGSHGDASTANVGFALPLAALACEGYDAH